MHIVLTDRMLLTQRKWKKVQPMIHGSALNIVFCLKTGQPWANAKRKNRFFENKIDDNYSESLRRKQIKWMNFRDSVLFSPNPKSNKVVHCFYLQN